MRTELPGGYVVIETRVSPAENVTLVVVAPDGRKATVHLPKGHDTPAEIIAQVTARLNARDKGTARR